MTVGISPQVPHSSPIALPTHPSSSETLIKRVMRAGLHALTIFIHTITNIVHYTINLPYRLGCFAARNITAISLRILFFIKPISIHGTLMKIATGLGYAAYNDGGICNGLAHMGIQAALINDVDSFNTRIKKLDLLLKQHYGNIDHVIKDLKKDPAFLNECLAFFDGITLWQSPSIYHEDLLKIVTSQNTSLHIERVAPITSSQKLEAEGGIHEVRKFSGVYNKNELTYYLKQLKTIFQNSSKTTPVAILFTKKNHATSLVYDPKKDSWLFIDANQLPITEHKDEATLVNELWDFSDPHTSRLPMSNYIYTLKNNSIKVKKELDLWLKTDEYKSLYDVSSRKKTLSPSEKQLWLLEASSLNEDLATVNSLLADNVDPNLFHPLSSSPLFAASQRGGVEIVTALLSAGANPNLADSNKRTPLLIAILTKDVEIVKILLSHGANVNCDKHHLGNPLKFAILREDLKIIEILLAHGANPNFKDSKGMTPLKFAKKLNNQDIYDLLVSHGATPDK